MEIEHDIVGFPLMMLKKCGIFSSTKPTKVIVVAALYMLLSIFVECMCLLQFPFIEGDVTDFTFNAEACGGIFQVHLKFFILAYQQKDFIKLLEITKPFWEASKCPANRKLELDNISSRILQLEKMFFGSAFLSVAFGIISVMFGRPVPLGVWKMEGYALLYNLYLAAQMLWLLMVPMFLAGFDCLFLALCTETVIQFRILSSCIEELNATNKHLGGAQIIYDNELKLCIHHHMFLLRFVKTLQNTYSSTLCVQYVASSALICIDMYLLLDNNGLPLLLRQTAFVLTQVAQLAFYCIAADYVTYEAMEVSNAIFSSGWHLQHSLSLRSILTIAIQRSQQQTTFRAGGLFNFNARALLNVVRASWSVCTVMRRIKDRN